MQPEILDDFQRFRVGEEHDSTIDGFTAVDTRLLTSPINTFWKPYAIDALTIHLNKRDALVMVPVASGLAPQDHTYSESNWAISSMWKEVFQLLRNGFMELDITELRCEITHHKRESYRPHFHSSRVQLAAPCVRDSLRRGSSPSLLRRHGVGRSTSAPTRASRAVLLPRSRRSRGIRRRLSLKCAVSPFRCELVFSRQ